eukprot:TRINITY_DN5986_c1_g2_i1.p1 TRINITY_DN5986_c1_g2~~TRINITY_DN5986_c1_g2_i1.p1  ORF type:complete len:401 (-),score=86.45 TRINITY_DN5986_c1_g2_i1:27-1229(-)
MSGNKSLYVGNLDPQITENFLHSIFAAIGPIEHCKIIRDKSTGASQGFGFVDFVDTATAAKALQTLANKKIFNHELRVGWAHQGSQQQQQTHPHPHPQHQSPMMAFQHMSLPYSTPASPGLQHQQQPPPTPPHQQQEGHFSIFVGDLASDVDDKTLLAAFSSFGTILESRVMWDSSTGRSRGYGFVTFAAKEHAEKAIVEMQGQFLGSRAIRCNWASTKEQQQQQALLQQASSAMSSAGLQPASLQAVMAQAQFSNHTVYVGNLASELAEDALRSLFQQFGMIDDVRLNREKGYAFLRFQSHEQAAHAILSMNGRSVSGKTLKCGWGKEKSAHPPMPQQRMYEYSHFQGTPVYQPYPQPYPYSPAYRGVPVSSLGAAQQSIYPHPQVAMNRMPGPQIPPS